MILEHHCAPEWLTGATAVAVAERRLHLAVERCCVQLTFCAGVSVVLTEAQRASSIQSSGTSGGDGSAPVLDVDIYASEDVALNGVTAVSGVQVVEAADGCEQ